MLFRYTENPPENRIFGPGFLRLGGWRMGYTENSSFPYTRWPCCDYVRFHDRSRPNSYRR